jgi:hypothetical protein
MGVRQPQQAQESDEDNLAEDRIAVDEEGDSAAHNGGFDQINYSHKTAFMFRPGLRRLCAGLPPQRCRLAECPNDYKISDRMSCAKRKLDFCRS